MKTLQPPLWLVPALIATLGGACLAPPAGAEPIFLVEDLETSAVDRGSRPSSVAGDGEVLYLSAEDDLHGEELWRTDGTPEGTSLVADVCPGRCSSSPARLVLAGGKLFFFADDGASGRELWVSDGTDAGTRQVADLCPGPCSPSVGALTSSGDDAYFFLRPASGGSEVWRSDGSSEGTRRLLSSGARTGPLGSLGEHLYFYNVTGGGGSSLWRTDGTSGGTERFLELCAAFCDDEPVAVGLFRGELYFAAYDGFRNLGLWKTDGTPAGTLRVTDVPEGSLSTDFIYSAQAGDYLYFSSSSCFEGACVRRTDGTPGGDTSTEEIFPYGSSAVRSGAFEAAGDRLFFYTDPPHDNEIELWVSDGTPGGALLLASGFKRWPSLHFGLGDTLFLSADQGDTGREPWVSDGTPDGTRLLRDVRPGPQSSGPYLPQLVAGRVVFVADDGAVGSEPWVSDGTTAGTTLLANLRPERRSSFPSALTSFGDRLLFAAGVEGGSLWTSPGAPASATRLASGLATEEVVTGEIAVLGERALFASGPEGRLWSTDGTAAGTFPISDVFEAELLTAAGGEVFFGSGTSGQELWASDGTVAGTRLVRDVDPTWRDFCGVVSPPCPPTPNLPNALAAFGGEVFFAAFTEGADPQLWKSDGTEDGTVLVREFAFDGVEPAPYYFDTAEKAAFFLPRSLTAAGSKLFFVGYESASGWELWASDGTPAGTSLVADLAAGPASSDPAHLVAVGSVVYFSARRADGGDELWASDGTPAGTSRIADLRLDGEGSNVVGAVASARRLFLSVSHPSTGAELWTSDGTTAGTRPVADLRPGVRGSSPSGFLSLGDGRVLFSADDGTRGSELWVSDGSAAGTFRVEDLAPGADPSSPEELTRVGERVFFSADDGVHGRELFGLELADLGDPPPPLPCPGDRLCLGGGRFEVVASWRDFEGGVGPGVPVPGASDDSGLFYFFAPDNWELMVKVLDGCAVNGHFWVLAAATTNVEYTLTVSDTLVPRDAVYDNPLGRASPAIIDTRAFSCP